MNLQTTYQQNVVPAWLKEKGQKSHFSVPRITKVVINVGLKEAKDDKKLIDVVGEQICVITGQKPKVCRAKKSIAGFKLGRNQPIGLMTTLRGQRAFSFLDKLITVVLPRVRDFNGLSRSSFDQGGNYSIGILEQFVFPEIEFSKVDKTRGLQITIVTNAPDKDQANMLLSKLGFPFEKTN